MSSNRSDVSSSSRRDSERRRSRRDKEPSEAASGRRSNNGNGDDEYSRRRSERNQGDPGRDDDNESRSDLSARKRSGTVTKYKFPEDTTSTHRGVDSPTQQQQQPYHAPGDGLSSNVPNQFPDQTPQDFALPYRPPLTSSTSYGEASSYYGDQGESVAHQPGVRPHTPIVTGTEPHLMAALPVAAPPVETGHGAAADFYGGSSTVSQPAPGQVIPPSNTTGSPPYEGGSGYIASSAVSLGQQSSMPQQTSSSQATPNRPFPPSVQASSFSTPIMAAGAVGAAGVAAALWEQHEQHQIRHSSNHSSHHSSHQSSENSYSNSGTQQGPGRQPSSGRPGRHSHGRQSSEYGRERGPVGRLVDWWKNNEDVRKMEEYTEYIGVCRNCFDPHSTPRDAPRRHHWRFGFRESRKSGRVNKHSRYSASSSASSSESDSEGHRRRRLAALTAGAAGVGILEANLHQREEGRKDDEERTSRHDSETQQGKTSESARYDFELDETQSRRRRSDRYDDRDRVEESRFVERSSTSERRRKHSEDGLQSKEKLLLAGAAALGVAEAARHSDSVNRKNDRRSDERRRRSEYDHGMWQYDDRRDESIAFSRIDRYSANDLRFENLPANASTPFNTEHKTPSKRKPRYDDTGYGMSSPTSPNDASPNQEVEFTRSKRSKQHRVGQGHTMGNSSEALLGLGAAAALLAGTEAHRRNRLQHQPELFAAKESRSHHHKDAYSRSEARHAEGVQSSEGEEWTDEDSSSVDSALAFGELEDGRTISRRSSLESLASASSATRKWDWRWNKKGERRRPNSAEESKSKRREGDSARPLVESVLFDVEAKNLGVSQLQSPPKVVEPQPLQYIDPIPLSDPSTPGRSPDRINPAAPFNIAPLQQPQPISPIKPPYIDDRGQSERFTNLRYEYFGTDSQSTRPQLSHAQTMPAMMPSISQQSVVYGSDRKNTSASTARPTSQREQSDSVIGKRARNTSAAAALAGVAMSALATSEKLQRRRSSGPVVRFASPIHIEESSPQKSNTKEDTRPELKTEPIRDIGTIPGQFPPNESFDLEQTNGFVTSSPSSKAVGPVTKRDESHDDDTSVRNTSTSFDDDNLQEKGEPKSGQPHETTIDAQIDSQRPQYLIRTPSDHANYDEPILDDDLDDADYFVKRRLSNSNNPLDIEKKSQTRTQSPPQAPSESPVRPKYHVRRPTDPADYDEPILDDDLDDPDIFSKLRKAHSTDVDDQSHAVMEQYDASQSSKSSSAAVRCVFEDLEDRYSEAKRSTSPAKFFAPPELLEHLDVLDHRMEADVDFNAPANPVTMGPSTDQAQPRSVPKLRLIPATPPPSPEGRARDRSQSTPHSPLQQELTNSSESNIDGEASDHTSKHRTDENDALESRKQESPKVSGHDKAEDDVPLVPLMNPLSHEKIDHVESGDDLSMSTTCPLPSIEPVSDLGLGLGVDRLVDPVNPQSQRGLIRDEVVGKLDTKATGENGSRAEQLNADKAEMHNANVDAKHGEDALVGSKPKGHIYDSEEPQPSQEVSLEGRSADSDQSREASGSSTREVVPAAPQFAEDDTRMSDNVNRYTNQENNTPVSENLEVLPSTNSLHQSTESEDLPGPMPGSFTFEDEPVMHDSETIDDAKSDETVLSPTSDPVPKTSNLNSVELVNDEVVPSVTVHTDRISPRLASVGGSGFATGENSPVPSPREASDGSHHSNDYILEDNKVQNEDEIKESTRQLESDLDTAKCREKPDRVADIPKPSDSSAAVDELATANDDDLERHEPSVSSILSDSTKQTRAEDENECIDHGESADDRIAELGVLNAGNSGSEVITEKVSSLNEDSDFQEPSITSDPINETPAPVLRHDTLTSFITSQSEDSTGATVVEDTGSFIKVDKVLHLSPSSADPFTSPVTDRVWPSEIPRWTPRTHNIFDHFEVIPEMIRLPPSRPGSPYDTDDETSQSPMDPARPALDSMHNRTPSSTAIPLRFRRPAQSPGCGKESPSIFSPNTEGSSPTSPTRARGNRPRSTEFKSNEFRPLYLVERNIKPLEPEEDALPSLPSSRTTSRAPSLHDSEENYESAVESPGAYATPLHQSPQSLSKPPERLDLTRNVPHELNEPDYLDSQQVTPKAATFPPGAWQVSDFPEDEQFKPSRPGPRTSDESLAYGELAKGFSVNHLVQNGLEDGHEMSAITAADKEHTSELLLRGKTHDVESCENSTADATVGGNVTAQRSEHSFRNNSISTGEENSLHNKSVTSTASEQSAEAENVRLHPLLHQSEAVSEPLQDGTDALTDPLLPSSSGFRSTEADHEREIHEIRSTDIERGEQPTFQPTIDSPITANSSKLPEPDDLETARSIRQTSEHSAMGLSMTSTNDAAGIIRGDINADRSLEQSERALSVEKHHKPQPNQRLGYFHDNNTMELESDPELIPLPDSPLSYSEHERNRNENFEPFRHHSLGQLQPLHDSSIDWTIEQDVEHGSIPLPNSPLPRSESRQYDVSEAVHDPNIDASKRHDFNPSMIPLPISPSSDSGSWHDIVTDQNSTLRQKPNQLEFFRTSSYDSTVIHEDDPSLVPLPISPLSESDLPSDTVDHQKISSYHKSTSTKSLRNLHNDDYRSDEDDPSLIPLPISPHLITDVRSDTGDDSKDSAIPRSTSPQFFRDAHVDDPDEMGKSLHSGVRNDSFAGEIQDISSIPKPRFPLSVTKVDNLHEPNPRSGAAAVEHSQEASSSVRERLALENVSESYTSPNPLINPTIAASRTVANTNEDQLADSWGSHSHVEGERSSADIVDEIASANASRFSSRKSSTPLKSTEPSVDQITETHNQAIVSDGQMTTSEIPENDEEGIAQRSETDLPTPLQNPATRGINDEEVEDASSENLGLDIDNEWAIPSKSKGKKSKKGRAPPVDVSTTETSFNQAGNDSAKYVTETPAPATPVEVEDDWTSMSKTKGKKNKKGKKAGNTARTPTTQSISEDLDPAQDILTIKESVQSSLSRNEDEWASQPKSKGKKGKKKALAMTAPAAALAAVVASQTFGQREQCKSNAETQQAQGGEYQPEPSAMSIPSPAEEDDEWATQPKVKGKKGKRKTLPFLTPPSAKSNAEDEDGSSAPRVPDVQPIIPAVEEPDEINDREVPNRQMSLNNSDATKLVDAAVILPAQDNENVHHTENIDSMISPEIDLSQDEHFFHAEPQSDIGLGKTKYQDTMAESEPARDLSTIETSTRNVELHPVPLTLEQKSLHKSMHDMTSPSLSPVLRAAENTEYPDRDVHSSDRNTMPVSQSLDHADMGLPSHVSAEAETPAWSSDYVERWNGMMQLLVSANQDRGENFPSMSQQLDEVSEDHDVGSNLQDMAQRDFDEEDVPGILLSHSVYQPGNDTYNTEEENIHKLPEVSRSHSGSEAGEYPIEGEDNHDTPKAEVLEKISADVIHDRAFEEMKHLQTPKLPGSFSVEGDAREMQNIDVSHQSSTKTIDNLDDEARSELRQAITLPLPEDDRDLVEEYDNHSQYAAVMQEDMSPEIELARGRDNVSRRTTDFHTEEDDSEKGQEHGSHSQNIIPPRYLEREEHEDANESMLAYLEYAIHVPLPENDINLIEEHEPDLQHMVRSRELSENEREPACREMQKSLRNAIDVPLPEDEEDFVEGDVPYVQHTARSLELSKDEREPATSEMQIALQNAIHIPLPKGQEDLVDENELDLRRGEGSKELSRDNREHATSNANIALKHAVELPLPNDDSDLDEERELDSGPVLGTHEHASGIHVIGADDTEIRQAHMPAHDEMHTTLRDAIEAPLPEDDTGIIEYRERALGMRTTLGDAAQVSTPHDDIGIIEEDDHAMKLRNTLRIAVQIPIPDDDTGITENHEHERAMRLRTTLRNAAQVPIPNDDTGIMEEDEPAIRLHTTLRDVADISSPDDDTGTFEEHEHAVRMVNTLKDATEVPLPEDDTGIVAEHERTMDEIRTTMREAIRVPLPNDDVDVFSQREIAVADMDTTLRDAVQVPLPEDGNDLAEDHKLGDKQMERTLEAATKVPLPDDGKESVDKHEATTGRMQSTLRDAIHVPLPDDGPTFIEDHDPAIDRTRASIREAIIKPLPEDTTDLNQKDEFYQKHASGLEEVSNEGVHPLVAEAIHVPLPGTDAGLVDSTSRKSQSPDVENQHDAISDNLNYHGVEDSGPKIANWNAIQENLNTQDEQDSNEQSKIPSALSVIEQDVRRLQPSSPDNDKQELIEEPLVQTQELKQSDVRIHEAPASSEEGNQTKIKLPTVVDTSETNTLLEQDLKSGETNESDRDHFSSARDPERKVDNDKFTPATTPKFVENSQETVEELSREAFDEYPQSAEVSEELHHGMRNEHDHDPVSVAVLSGGDPKSPNVEGSNIQEAGNNWNMSSKSKQKKKKNSKNQAGKSLSSTFEESFLEPKDVEEANPAPQTDLTQTPSGAGMAQFLDKDDKEAQKEDLQDEWLLRSGSSKKKGKARAKTKQVALPPTIPVGSETQNVSNDEVAHDDTVIVAKEDNTQTRDVDAAIENNQEERETDTNNWAMPAKSKNEKKGKRKSVASTIPAKTNPFLAKVHEDIVDRQSATTLDIIDVSEDRDISRGMIEPAQEDAPDEWAMTSKSKKTKKGKGKIETPKSTPLDDPVHEIIPSGDSQPLPSPLPIQSVPAEAYLQDNFSNNRAETKENNDEDEWAPTSISKKKKKSRGGKSIQVPPALAPDPFDNDLTPNDPTPEDTGNSWKPDTDTQAPEEKQDNQTHATKELVQENDTQELVVNSSFETVENTSEAVDAATASSVDHLQETDVNIGQNRTNGQDLLSSETTLKDSATDLPSHLPQVDQRALAKSAKDLDAADFHSQNRNEGKDGKRGKTLSNKEWRDEEENEEDKSEQNTHGQFSDQRDLVRSSLMTSTALAGGSALAATFLNTETASPDHHPETTSTSRHTLLAKDDDDSTIGGPQQLTQQKSLGNDEQMTATSPGYEAHLHKQQSELEPYFASPAKQVSSDERETLLSTFRVIDDGEDHGSEMRSSALDRGLSESRHELRSPIDVLHGSETHEKQELFVQHHGSQEITEHISASRDYSDKEQQFSSRPETAGRVDHGRTPSPSREPSALEDLHTSEQPSKTLTRKLSPEPHHESLPLDAANSPSKPDPLSPSSPKANSASEEFWPVTVVKSKKSKKDKRKGAKRNTAELVNEPDQAQLPIPSAETSFIGNDPAAETSSKYRKPFSPSPSKMYDETAHEIQRHAVIPLSRSDTSHGTSESKFEKNASIKPRPDVEVLDREPSRPASVSLEPFVQRSTYAENVIDLDANPKSLTEDENEMKVERSMHQNKEYFRVFGSRTQDAGAHSLNSERPVSTYSEVTSSVPHRSPSPVVQMESQEQHSGNKKKIDFAATLAAGLEDSGFDPGLITQDSSFHSRTKSPGSSLDHADDEYQPVSRVRQKRRPSPDKLHALTREQEDVSHFPAVTNVSSERLEPSFEDDVKSGLCEAGFKPGLFVAMSRRGSLAPSTIELLAKNDQPGGSELHNANHSDNREVSMRTPSPTAPSAGWHAMPNPDVTSTSQTIILPGKEYSLEQTPVQNSRAEHGGVITQAPLQHARSMKEVDAEDDRSRHLEDIPAQASAYPQEFSRSEPSSKKRNNGKTNNFQSASNVVDKVNLPHSGMLVGAAVAAAGASGAYHEITTSNKTPEVKDVVRDSGYHDGTLQSSQSMKSLKQHHEAVVTPETVREEHEMEAPPYMKPVHNSGWSFATVANVERSPTQKHAREKTSPVPVRSPVASHHDQSNARDTGPFRSEASARERRSSLQSSHSYGQQFVGREHSIIDDDNGAYDSPKTIEPPRQPFAMHPRSSVSSATSEIANTRRAYRRSATGEDKGTVSGSSPNSQSQRSLTPTLRRTATGTAAALALALGGTSPRQPPLPAPLTKPSPVPVPGSPSTLDAPPLSYAPLKGSGKDRRQEMAKDDNDSTIYESSSDVRSSPRSRSQIQPPRSERRQVLDRDQTMTGQSTGDYFSHPQTSTRDPRELGFTSEAYVDHGSLIEAIQTRDTQLREKDGEINDMRSSLGMLQYEVTKLQERNEELQHANRNLSDDTNGRYATLQAEHARAHQQWQMSARQLEELRDRHGELATNMDDIVEREISAGLTEKDAEIRHLRTELDRATEQIRFLQREILASKPDESYLTVRDEDYFETACQQLCEHVQRWVLRFSKSSDNRLCRMSEDLHNEAIETRLDNAILDGTDVDLYLGDRIKRRDVFMSVVMTMIWEYVFTRYLFGMDREQRQKLKALEKTLIDVGPPRAVAQWRVVTLTLLSRRDAFAAQRTQDTEAVVQEIYNTLAALLPPPSQYIGQLQDSLRNVMKLAVDLSIEMRTQRPEYVMLPPLHAEYDTNGNITRKVYFNSLMNERSGDFASNEELEARSAVVRLVLFPLVVKRGDDQGEGDEEIVVCPAQVLVVKPTKEKKVVRVMSGAMSIDSPVANRSMQSLVTSQLSTNNAF